MNIPPPEPLLSTPKPTVPDSYLVPLKTVTVPVSYKLVPLKIINVPIAFKFDPISQSILPQKYITLPIEFSLEVSTVQKITTFDPFHNATQAQ